MVQEELDFSRGRNNPQSQKAHETLKPKKRGDRFRVWEIVYEAKTGISLESIADRLGKPVHAVSGRLSELSKMGMVQKKTELGKTKQGNDCALYIP